MVVNLDKGTSASKIIAIAIVDIISTSFACSLNHIGILNLLSLNGFVSLVCVEVGFCLFCKLLLVARLHSQNHICVLLMLHLSPLVIRN